MKMCPTLINKTNTQLVGLKWRRDQVNFLYGPRGGSCYSESLAVLNGLHHSSGSPQTPYLLSDQAYFLLSGTFCAIGSRKLLAWLLVDPFPCGNDHLHSFALETDPPQPLLWSVFSLVKLERIFLLYSAIIFSVLTFQLYQIFLCHSHFVCIFIMPSLIVVFNKSPSLLLSQRV